MRERERSSGKSWAGSAGSGKIQKKQHGRKNDVFDGSQNLRAWCDMALRDVARHSAALRDSTWRGATWRSVALCDSTWLGVTWRSVALCGTSWRCATQHGALVRGLAWSSIARRFTPQPKVTLCSIALLDVAW